MPDTMEGKLNNITALRAAQRLPNRYLPFPHSLKLTCQDPINFKNN